MGRFRFFSPNLYVGLFTMPPVKFILINCKIDWGQIKKPMHWRNTSPDDRKGSTYYILFTKTQFQQGKTWVFRPFSGNRKCKISGASGGFAPRTPTRALPWTHWGAYSAPRPQLVLAMTSGHCICSPFLTKVHIMHFRPTQSKILATPLDFRLRMCRISIKTE